ncbi:type VI secretion system contractile sheath small subunit [Citrobacter sp. S2-9]|uniref:Type VI secretion system contractile sheath small subunit n=1 Tax=Citrobacter enshiensis TaxID=2971264 RepID=A0ABT8Q1G3_9ENTR|nr:type VI secretion system contractile sheath small subunit [Citrobacter enshiensis]MDN8602180.1 type VI secretion system contractile sheath small subunit [Citrobacter enshiensis]
MSSQKYGGSIAPRERINIHYVPRTNDQAAEVELPLNIVVVGDTKGSADETPIDERQSVSINKNNFRSVMAEVGIKTTVTVADKLSEKPDGEMNVTLDIRSLDDFSPDNIARQVPEMKKLLELREALVALRGPMGNVPAFRAQLQALLDNEETREQLLRELDIIDQN